MTHPRPSPPIAPMGALAILSLALAACAPTSRDADTGGAEARPCFLVRQVNGFSEGARRDGRIYLRAGLNDTYEVSTQGGCPDIDWALSVGVDPAYGGSRRCVGDLIQLIVPSPGRGADRCLARVTRKLTDEERRAL